MPTYPPGPAHYGEGRYGVDHYGPVDAPPPPPPGPLIEWPANPVIDDPGHTPLTQYTLTTWDLVSGRMLGELQPGPFQYERVLSGAGAAQIELVLPQHRVAARAHNELTTPSRTGVLIERNRIPVWAGIIWQRDPVREDPSRVVLKCAEVWSYFRRRYITHLLRCFEWEQFRIIEALLDYAQGREPGWQGRWCRLPNASIGVAFEAEPSGQRRDRQYNGHVAPKQVAEAVEQMCDNIGGFDFTLDGERDESGRVRLTWRGWHPRRTRPAVLTGWRAEYGANVVGVVPAESPGIWANRVIASSESGDEIQLRATAVASWFLDTGYPLLEETITGHNVVIQDTLQGKADARLDQLTHLDTIDAVRVNPDHPLLPLGRFELGDLCDVVLPASPPGDNGMLAARFPDGLREQRRIVAYEVNVGLTEETVDVRFEKPDPVEVDDREEDLPPKEEN